MLSEAWMLQTELKNGKVQETKTWMIYSFLPECTYIYSKNTIPRASQFIFTPLSLSGSENTRIINQITNHLLPFPDNPNLPLEAATSFCPKVGQAVPASRLMELLDMQPTREHIQETAPHLSLQATGLAMSSVQNNTISCSPHSLSPFILLPKIMIAI